ncbi:hypothetical protein GGI42DRAFT_230338 [Trichoderma sp. SZMC 28013]
MNLQLPSAHVSQSVSVAIYKYRYRSIRGHAWQLEINTMLVPILFSYSGIGQGLRRLCVAGSRHHKTRLATSKHRETQHLDRTNKRHQCLCINHKHLLGASTSLAAVLGLAAELGLPVHACTYDIIVLLCKVYRVCVSVALD